MIPSAPLSSSARALISRPVCFPTNVTLSVIEGDRIFRIVSPGTGSESSVSSRWYLFKADERDNVQDPTDSAAVDRFKNPH